MKILLWIVLLTVSIAQLACTDMGNEAPVPVIDGWKQGRQGDDYRVQPGDSLYSVAWAFGVDYHNLARYNQLTEPYALHAGQLLHMYPPAAAPIVQPKVIQAVAPAAPTSRAVVVVSSPASSPVTPPASPPRQNVLVLAQPRPKSIPQTVNAAPPAVIATKTIPKAMVTAPVSAGPQKWLWPTKGRVMRGYSAASGGNHGLDIAGKLNQPVLASAPGKVVYAGSGMPGYGNLIIIKHNESDLSAYAFNKTLDVKEGDSVKAGQCIASMGKNDAGQTLLHFEIRRDGKPVDPRNYLK